MRGPDPGIAYLTGSYPRGTDTFIRREVRVLRESTRVETFAIRRPALEPRADQLLREEHARTISVLPASIVRLLRVHIRLLVRRPRHYASGLGLAFRSRGAGLRSALYQVFYFVEAGVVADEIRSRGLVHVHNHHGDSSCYVAMLAAALAGCTFSFTVHGPNEFFEPGKWRLDVKIRRAVFVACISRYCRDRLEQLGGDGCAQGLRVIHCGVEPSRYRIRRHSHSGSTLLFAGRLEWMKGVEFLLECFASLVRREPQLRLRIAGDGPDRGALEFLASRLGLDEQVIFVGHRSEDEIATELESADVFVLPSRAEGLPVSLMEAMAAGVPAITTRIAGIPELVEDGVNGYLVEPGDAGAFEDRVERLIGDPALRARMGAAARARVEDEFDLRCQTQQLAGLFAEATGRPRTASRGRGSGAG